MMINDRVNYNQRRIYIAYIKHYRTAPHCKNLCLRESGSEEENIRLIKHIS